MSEQDVTLLSIRPLEDDQVRDSAKQLHELVRQRSVAAQLANMHLPGVLRYFGGSNEAAEKNLFATRDEIKWGWRDTLLVTSNLPGEVGQIVGMASINPGRELRRQWSQMRPNNAQRLPWLSRQVTAVSEGARLTAWVDPQRPEPENDLGQTYYYLNRNALAKAPHWTLVADTAHLSRVDVVAAVEWAGFQAVKDGFYDDRQAPNDLLPTSTLYINHQPLTEPS